MTDFPLPNGWDGRTLAALRRKLLTWFDAHQRSLPWRETRDPYAIWVSEVMLQQTTVAAVIPFYERFLRSFPTIQHLAEAEEQAVLHHWQGLGYYRRARHLHAAAKVLVANHGVELPDDPKVWAALPGVGRYILGAVLSQAFDRKMPIVEANTLRVLSRLFGSRLDPRNGIGQKWVWAAAETMLPNKRIGDFNQAMMELGALLCTPSEPDCEACPWKNDCIARISGLQNEIPPKAMKKPPTAVREVALVLHHQGRILLMKRADNAKRWASMWEVPHGELLPGENEMAGAERIANELVGARVTLGPELTTIRHTVTRFAITMVVFEAEAVTKKFVTDFYVSGEWLLPKDLANYPASTPQRKLLAELVNANRVKRLC